MSTRALALVLLAVGVALASTIIHYPGLVELPLSGLTYSDIVSVYSTIVAEAHLYKVTLGSETPVVVITPLHPRWFSVTDALEFVEGKTCPIPYVDYGLEYPSLVGVLWYVSVCVSGGDVGRHYLVHAVVLSVALVVSAYLLYLVLSAVRPSEAAFRAALFLVLPSTVVYAVYNWDLLALVFTLASLYTLLRGRVFLAGLFLGLSASAKLLPSVAGVVVAAWILGRIRRGELQTRGLVAFVAGGVVGALPLAVTALAAPTGVLWMSEYISGWFCENCVYNLLTRDIFSPVNKIASVAAVVAATALVSYLVYAGKLDVARGFAIAVSSAAILNYIYTPQMVLLVTPMMLVSAPRVLLPTVVLADIFNALVMAVFFEREAVASLLRAIGIPHVEPPSPFDVHSIVQLFANARNALHLASAAGALYLARDGEDKNG